MTAHDKDVSIAFEAIGEMARIVEEAEQNHPKKWKHMIQGIHCHDCH